MRIVVVSGKGGAGKTTFSVILSLLLSNEVDIELIDSDVEEPNSNLFLGVNLESKSVYRKIPRLNSEICTGCGKCADICAYNAVVMVKQKPLIFTDLCHSCGGCVEVCPVDALTEVDDKYGEIGSGNSENIEFKEGRIDVGKIQSPMLIKELLADKSSDRVQIVDAPPGTACNTVQALYGADFALIVAEPTPFGTSDFKLIHELTKVMNIDSAVVVNKDEGYSENFYKLCKSLDVPVLATVPFDEKLSRYYSIGDLKGYLKNEDISHYKGAVDGLKSLIMSEKENG
ncbi:MAG TPA: ATP-binding protein [Spirochaetota bacterium]|nr:ATP-binding protein [Spirochaetota bacterium]